MITLPEVRGKLEYGRPLADLTWLRVGGPAEVLFQPADTQDLAEFLTALDPAVPVTPLGVGSNLIVRDGGLPGVSIRLGRGFNAIDVEGSSVRAGAASLDAHVAMRAAKAGVAGLEFLRTIPGAVGGAVRMNAGCYGTYTADVVESVTLITRAGEVRELAANDIGFGYRSSELPEEGVVVAATFRGRPGDPAESATLMAEYIRRREESQPVKDRSAGSTFRNPAGYSSTGEAGDPMDLKAWKLIDDAGCRGLRRGGAQMSEKHPNFLINTGDATAWDMEMLGEDVRARVKSASGHDLTWEIQRIGVFLEDQRRY